MIRELSQDDIAQVSGGTTTGACCVSQMQTVLIPFEPIKPLPTAVLAVAVMLPVFCTVSPTAPTPVALP